MRTSPALLEGTSTLALVLLLASARAAGRELPRSLRGTLVKVPQGVPAPVASPRRRWRDTDEASVNGRARRTATVRVRGRPQSSIRGASPC